MSLTLHPDVKAKVESARTIMNNDVKDHFFNPRNLVRDEKELNLDNYNGIGMVGSAGCGDAESMWLRIENDRIKECKWQTFGCLIPGTNILMKDFKTKAVENLNIGDEIIGGDGEINFVTRVLSQDYNGKIITFRLSTSNYYTITTTPNHIIPCVLRNRVALINRSSGKRWSEVNESLIDGIESYNLPAYELKEGDFLFYEIPKKIIDVAELNEDMCILLGYYVSDGNLKDNKRVKFDFSLDEQEYISEIEAIAKGYNWPSITYPRKDAAGIIVEILNVELVNLLRKFGGGPNKKDFSDEVLYLPYYKQMLIIDAYINGDGWDSKQKETYNEQYFISTSIEHIAYQIQLMLARNLIFAPIHKRKPRNFIIRNKSYTNSGEYDLVFKKVRNYSRFKIDKKKSKLLIPISKIVISDYIGKVYDISLAYSPNTYRVKGISIHNCGSAIASSSILSVMLTENDGMKVNDAMNLGTDKILEKLGEVSSKKVHCSILCIKTLRDAINDYYKRTGQYKNILVEGARIIDPLTKTTDKDIEEAVLKGALNLEDVEKKLNISFNKDLINEIEELIKFYNDKYLG